MSSPYVKDWGIYFPTGFDYKIRDQVVKEFRDFCFSSNNKIFTPEAEFYFGGKVFDDPDPTPTDNKTDRLLRGWIKQIERVEDDLIGQKRFCVTMDTGIEYYYLAKDINPSIKRMLIDIHAIRQLTKSSKYYVKDSFRGLDLL